MAKAKKNVSKKTTRKPAGKPTAPKKAATKPTGKQVVLEKDCCVTVKSKRYGTSYTVHNVRGNMVVFRNSDKKMVEPTKELKERIRLKK